MREKACKVHNSKTTLFSKCVEKIKKQMSYIYTEEEQVTTDKSKQQDNQGGKTYISTKAFLENKLKRTIQSMKN